MGSESRAHEAIDSEAMRVRGIIIIVLVKSNLLVKKIISHKTSCAS